MRNQLTARAVTVLTATLALCGVFAGVAEASDPIAYITSEKAGTLRQIDLATGALGAPIAIGSKPVAVAITPDGSTAYVADYGSSEVVPVALATGAVGAPIALSDRPAAIAIAPGGRTAYVISDSGREWPITLATDHLGNPSLIPANSDAIAITPAGTAAYITNVADGTLSPFTLSSGSVGQPINLNAATPDGVAITPDGTTAYVASNSGGTLTPVNLAAGTAGAPIAVGPEPTAVAVSADGTTAYVTNFSTGQITPVALATGTAGTPIPAVAQPSAIALVPPSGVTTAPPGAYGNTGGSGGAGGGAPTTTLGDQQLTLRLSSTGGGSSGGGSGGTGSAGTGSAGTGSGGTGSSGGGAGVTPQACHSARSTIVVRLTRHNLKRGAHLKLRNVIFRFGKKIKRAKRLPAVARFPLRGLRPRTYTIIARVFYNERVARAGRHSKRKLTVTISKALKTRFTIC